jgi:Flp pilus assembly protein TadD
MAQKQAAGAKSNLSVAQLIAQGKALYRAQRLKPALAKFEAALKLDPENDEALSLAAVTAFRLDLQPQSRDYFVRRRGRRIRSRRSAITEWL